MGIYNTISYIFGILKFNLDLYIYAYTHRQINILSTDIYLFLIYPIYTNSTYKTPYNPLNKYAYIQIFILLIYGLYSKWAVG